MKTKRAHVWIEGKVQGVWFRESTKVEALEQGVAGWVQNLPDGRVEAVFEGDAAAVDRMLAWCHVGSREAEVARIVAQEELPLGELPGFRVQR